MGTSLFYFGDDATAKSRHFGVILPHRVDRTFFSEQFAEIHKIFNDIHTVFLTETIRGGMFLVAADALTVHTDKTNVFFDQRIDHLIG